MAYNILIVEDDLVTAKFTERIADDLGYKIVGICSSGEESLEFLKSEKCDLVLMDIGLAGELDGIKTADMIIDRFNIPVIYATGASDSETMQRAIESSTFGYIIKPVKKEQLYTMIELTIQRYQLETALKERELELKKLNELLEEKVKERTKELRLNNRRLEDEVERRKAIEEDLKVALAKEKELSELKSRVVTLVSHELKTPLTTILSSTQLIDFHLDNKAPGEKILKHTRTIQKAVHNLTGIVNDTLFISKAEADKVELELKPINIPSFIRDLIGQIQDGPGSEHNISCEFLPRIPDRLNIDSRLFKNIANNLISNAVKYSLPGTDVNMTLDYKDGEVVFAVKDSGIGIPKDDLKYLFNMFHRASNVENIEGSGVGLAIVKKCVDFMKGDIYVVSEEGKGSTFTVTFKADIPEKREG